MQMQIPIILSRYIAKKFFVGTVIAFLILVSLIILFDFIELMRKSISHDIPFSVIIQMCLLKFPNTSQQILPFAILHGYPAHLNI